jgi:hypothetical protein
MLARLQRDMRDAVDVMEVARSRSVDGEHST